MTCRPCYTLIILGSCAEIVCLGVAQAVVGTGFDVRAALDEFEGCMLV